jgi:hypothetical protein
MPPKSINKPAKKSGRKPKPVDDDIVDVDEEQIVSTKAKKVVTKAKRTVGAASTAKKSKKVVDTDGLDELDAELDAEAVGDAEIADIINADDAADLEDPFPAIDEDDLNLDDVPEPEIKAQAKPAIAKQTKSDRTDRSDRQRQPIERVDPNTKIGELKISRILDYIYQYGKENDNPIAMSGALTFKNRLSGNGLGPNNKKRFNKNRNGNQNQGSGRQFSAPGGQQPRQFDKNSRNNGPRQNHGSGPKHFDAPFTGRTVGAVKGRPAPPSNGEIYGD